MSDNEEYIEIISNFLVLEGYKRENLPNDLPSLYNKLLELPSEDPLVINLRSEIEEKIKIQEKIADND